MEELLQFLVEHFDDCPVHPLIDGHFLLRDKNIVSQQLTLTKDMLIFPAEWSDSGELRIGKILYSSEVDVMVDRESVLMSIGRGGWQRVQILGLSNDVMRWLLLEVPAAKQLCDHQLKGSVLCPENEQLEKKEILEPETPSSLTEEILKPEVINHAPVITPDGTEPRKYSSLFILLIICFVIFALSGSAFLLYKWYTTKTKFNSTVILSDHVSSKFNDVVNNAVSDAWISL